MINAPLFCYFAFVLVFSSSVKGGYLCLSSQFIIWGVFIFHRSALCRFPVLLLKIFSDTVSALVTFRGKLEETKLAKKPQTNKQVKNHKPHHFHCLILPVSKQISQILPLSAKTYLRIDLTGHTTHLKNWLFLNWCSTRSAVFILWTANKILHRQT